MDKAVKIMISDITLRQNCALIKGSDEIFAFFHATNYCMNILQLKHDRIITVSNFKGITNSNLVFANSSINKNQVKIREPLKLSKKELA